VGAGRFVLQTVSLCSRNFKVGFSPQIISSRAQNKRNTGIINIDIVVTDGLGHWVQF
jgi:hypothetical protein